MTNAELILLYTKDRIIKTFGSVVKIWSKTLWDSYLETALEEVYDQLTPEKLLYIKDLYKNP